ncbi:hypothetical protein D3C72_1928070 [compost metagenome]
MVIMVMIYTKSILNFLALFFIIFNLLVFKVPSIFLDGIYKIYAINKPNKNGFITSIKTDILADTPAKLSIILYIINSKTTNINHEVHFFIFSLTSLIIYLLIKFLILILLGSDHYLQYDYKFLHLLFYL